MPGAEMVFGEFDPDCAAIVYPAPPPTNSATLAATATGASQERLKIGATFPASASTEARIAARSGVTAELAGSFARNNSQDLSLVPSIPNSFVMVSPSVPYLSYVST
jgi:hypothetical protein